MNVPVCREYERSEKKRENERRGKNMERGK
jgi:hypothetical protein